MIRGKAWLTNEIEIMGSETGENYPHEQMVDREVVLNLIDQLDESEKVIIPQFVADYIEKYNVDEYGLMSIGDWLDIDLRDEVDKKVDAWLYDCSYCVEEIIEREMLLINAIQRGYEVEKEKLYYVIGKSRRPILTIHGGKVTSSVSALEVERAEKLLSPDFKYRLTEKQIKDYDERYWSFAEEVSE